MAPLISVETLTAWPGPWDTVTAGQLAAVLEGASAEVRLAAKPELDLVDETTGDCPPAIVPVLVGMVRRGLDNPKELTGESIGDYRWQGGANSVHPTRREKRIIRQAVEKLGAGNLQTEGYLPVVASEYSDDELSEITG